MTGEEQTAFVTAGNNHLFKAVMGSLSDFIKDEVETTLSLDTQGEERAYSAGRASSLTDFRNHLEWMKNEAEARAESNI